jgi:hypothetical protein
MVLGGEAGKGHGGVDGRPAAAGSDAGGFNGSELPA